MRKNLFRFLFVAAALIGTSATAMSQVTVKGRVVDAESKEALIGAVIMPADGSSKEAVTDVNGGFTLSVAPNATLSVRYLGYKEVKRQITQQGTVDLGTIELEYDAFALDDVTITSSIAVARRTPVALSSVDPIFIEEKLGTREFPEILKATPGVYATKQGGGFGDSKINMRGFKSENIAVMINGVPMNDMEWGGVYWSNWAGLSDVTRSMQTQRGLGASKVAAPSVGGSINIITKTIDAEKGGMISYGMGNDGYNKVMFSLSTGLTESGWALTVLGGKTWGDGYIQGTEFDGYNYFLNVAKRINDKHQLSLTAFGAPQKHDQRNRNDGLTIEEWQKVKNYMNGDSPYKYNPTYGYGLNGERKTSARNVYHKPQISLNHLWQIDQKSSLSTALYTSIGRGYGYGGQGLTSEYRNKWYGSTNGILNTEFRKPDGTFAYDEIYALNQASTEGSLMAMSKSVNEHNWYGLLSTYTTKFGDKFDFYGGLDLRYYKGVHTNELIDLYGGDYFMDASSRGSVVAVNNAAAANPNFKNEKLQVGDVVYRDYDGFVAQGGIFAQLEYNAEKLSAFVAGSLSNSRYWRKDRFYYDAAHAESDKEDFLGYTIKGGANYNLTQNHNVFANIGYISRAPYFSGGVFLSSAVSNVTNPDPVNEKIFSVELGYGYQSKFFAANLNAYYTEWKDKTMAKSKFITDGNGSVIDQIVLNMKGVNATHMGIELDLTAKPFSWLDITGMFSIGSWEWTNDPIGYYYDSGGQPVKGEGKDANGLVIIEHATGIQSPDHAWAKLGLDGVKVGGSAQTTAAIGASFKPLRGLKVGVDYTLYARNYADWDLSTSLGYNEYRQYSTPWRMPSAGVYDLSASYKFEIGNIDATIYGNLENVFNTEYITDAYDGGNHDWKTAYRVFYGFGRTGSVRLKISF
ncbi:MAG: TonB-dependent receptor [Prevotellaceae bacterium]|jgi:outer membrane cobalamin receptor|nr:TonB-dependent receptor [Prevotellaceae bacterium]